MPTRREFLSAGAAMGVLRRRRASRHYIFLALSSQRIRSAHRQTRFPRHDQGHLADAVHGRGPGHVQRQRQAHGGHGEGQRHQRKAPRQGPQERGRRQASDRRGSDRADLRHHRRGGAVLRRGHPGRSVDQAAGRRQQHPASRSAVEEGPHLHVRDRRRAGGGLGGRSGGGAQRKVQDRGVGVRRHGAAGH